MKRMETLGLVAMALLFSAGRASAESEIKAVLDCAGIPDIKSKSRQLFEGKTLMVSLSMLEAQGEAHFRPKYPEPASECVFERFDLAGKPVTAVYSPFEKGEQTLHYRFLGEVGGESREVVVLYDGMTSLVAKKTVFFVIENRGGRISYYAMFREQPSYAALKPLVTSILDGSAAPLATVHWPKGEKEAVIDAYDTTRLK
jgi:hypothetical protein